jgi:hypothetical protein
MPIDYRIRSADDDIGERMRRLLHLIAAKTADDMRNRLEFLSDW